MEEGDWAGWFWMELSGDGWGDLDGLDGWIGCWRDWFLGLVWAVLEGGKNMAGTVCSGTERLLFRYCSGPLFHREPPYLLLFSPYRNIGTVRGVKEGE